MADSLGKGLESLIPQKTAEEIPAAPDMREESPIDPSAVEEKPRFSLDEFGKPKFSNFNDHFVPRKSDAVFWIEIEKIEPNPFQPRREFNEEMLKELAASIREHGVLQPILVTKREIETSKGLDVRYQLIAGERRWRAAALAGLSQIPAIIRRGVPDDRLKLELALIENVQREDLNPLERAMAFKQLIDEFHMVQREIAERIGKSREMVTNTLRLLSLTPEIQEALRVGRITEGHARAILMAGEEAAKQMEVFTAVVSDRLTVREAENKARQIGGKIFVPRKRPARAVDPEMRNLEQKLEEILGTKVRIERLGERGKIIAEFYSEEELRGILDKIIKET